MQFYGTEFPDEPFETALATMLSRNMPFTASALLKQLNEEFRKDGPGWALMPKYYASRLLQKARKQGLVRYRNKRWHKMPSAPEPSPLVLALQSAQCAMELALCEISDDTPRSRATGAALGFAYRDVHNALLWLRKDDQRQDAEM